MTRRALGWTAVAVFLFGVNTGVMVWLRGGGGAGGGAAPGARVSLEAPPETPVRPRPARWDREAPPAQPETVGLAVLVTDTRTVPLPGAAVRVLPFRRAFRSPFPDEVLAEGTAGADGRARFEGLPATAGWRVEASAPGRATATATGPGPEITVALWRAGSLSGRVLEEGTDAPVEGATVEVRQDPVRDGAVASASTGPDGTFSIGGLGRGTWSCSVTSPRHGSADRTAFIEEGMDTAVEFHLPRGMDLAGRVLYSGSDRPLPGGRIRVGFPVRGDREHPGFREAAVDAEGRFRLIGLPPEASGQGCLVTTAEGAVIAVPMPRIRTDPATGLPQGDLVISIPWNAPTLSYGGRVTDARGRPVADARVLVGNSLARGVEMRDRGVNADLRETRTDADGKWSLPGSGYAGGEVLILHPDFAPGSFVLPYRSRNRTFDFTLADPGALLVVVRGGPSERVAGVEVRALLRHPDAAMARTEFGDVLESLRPNPVTDSEGRAVVGPLGPGTWYLVARTADDQWGGKVLVEWAPGEVLQGVVDLPMYQVPVLRGRVRDLDGGPVAGVRVSVTDGSTRDTREVETGAGGEFTLPGFPFLPWQAPGQPSLLSLRAEGWKAGVPSMFVQAVRPVEWVVARPADAPEDLVVRVFESPGRPALDVSWEMRFDGGGGRAEGWGADVPGMGVLTVPRIRGRNAVLTVTAPGRGSGSVHLDALDEPTPTLDLILD